MKVKDLQDAIVGAMTAAAFMQLLEQEPGRHEVLLKLCEMYVKQYREADVENLDRETLCTPMKIAAQKIKVVFDAIIVLLNPVPGVLGTDVSCITVMLDTDEYRKGPKQNPFLVAVATMLTNHDGWQKKMDDCLVKGAAGMKHVKEFRELTDAIADENEDSTKHYVITDSLRGSAAQLTQFRKDLRPGATECLECQLKERVERICKWTMQKEDDTSGLAEDHLEVLTALLSALSHHKDMLALSTQLKTWAGKISKVMGMQRLIALSENSEKDVVWSEVLELLDGLSLVDSAQPQDVKVMRALAKKHLEHMATKATVLFPHKAAAVDGGNQASLKVPEKNSEY